MIRTRLSTLAYWLSVRRHDRVELVEGELSDAQDDGCDHDVGHTDDTSEGGELEAIHGSQAGERTHEESPEDDGQGDLVVQPGGEDVKGDNVGEDITNGNDITIGRMVIDCCEHTLLLFPN